MPSFITQIEVKAGDLLTGTCEARYSFTVVPARPARTWANAADGFSPAEGPSVERLVVHVRWHSAAIWREAEPFLHDLLTDGVTDEWLLSQIEAEEV